MDGHGGMNVQISVLRCFFALSFGLVTIAAFVNEEVRKKARTQLGKWFPSVQEEDLKEVESKL